ncbi:hypothetical protein KJ903_03735 [Patescibacteria group bacterium]|nr:hypothetical protein [Patescibacteria group bacterium]
MITTQPTSNQEPREGESSESLTGFDIESQPKQKKLFGLFLERHGQTNLRDRLRESKLQEGDLRVLHKYREQYRGIHSEVEWANTVMSPEVIDAAVEKSEGFRIVADTLGKDRARDVIGYQLGEVAVTNPGRFTAIKKRLKEVAWRVNRRETIQSHINTKCSEYKIDLSELEAAKGIADSKKRQKAISKLVKSKFGWMRRAFNFITGKDKVYTQRALVLDQSMVEIRGLKEEVAQMSLHVGRTLALTADQDPYVREAIAEELAKAEEKASKKDQGGDQKKTDKNKQAQAGQDRDERKEQDKKGKEGREEKEDGKKEQADKPAAEKKPELVEVGQAGSTYFRLGGGKGKDARWVSVVDKEGGRVKYIVDNRSRQPSSARLEYQYKVLVVKKPERGGDMTIAYVSIEAPYPEDKLPELRASFQEDFTKIVDGLNLPEDQADDIQAAIGKGHYEYVTNWLASRSYDLQILGLQTVGEKLRSTLGEMNLLDTREKEVVEVGQAGNGQFIEEDAPIKRDDRDKKGSKVEKQWVLRRQIENVKVKFIIRWKSRQPTSDSLGYNYKVDEVRPKSKDGVVIAFVELQPPFPDDPATPSAGDADIKKGSDSSPKDGDPVPKAEVVARERIEQLLSGGKALGELLADLIENKTVVFTEDDLDRVAGSMQAGDFAEATAILDRALPVDATERTIIEPELVAPRQAIVGLEIIAQNYDGNRVPTFINFRDIFRKELKALRKTRAKAALGEGAVEGISAAGKTGGGVAKEAGSDAAAGDGKKAEAATPAELKSRLRGIFGAMEKQGFITSADIFNRHYVRYEKWQEIWDKLVEAKKDYKGTSQDDFAAVMGEIQQALGQLDKAVDFSARAVSADAGTPDKDSGGESLLETTARTRATEIASRSETTEDLIATLTNEFYDSAGEPLVAESEVEELRAFLYRGDYKNARQATETLLDTYQSDASLSERLHLVLALCQEVTQTELGMARKDVYALITAASGEDWASNLDVATAIANFGEGNFSDVMSSISRLSNTRETAKFAGDVRTHLLDIAQREIGEHWRELEDLTDYLQHKKIIEANVADDFWRCLRDESKGVSRYAEAASILQTALADYRGDQVDIFRAQMGTVNTVIENIKISADFVEEHRGK